MTGRLPLIDDGAAIAERLREIQAERIRMIAGCHCPRDALGAATHNTLCPLRPEPASQMQLTLDAMRRARERIDARRASLEAAQARLALPAEPCPAERYIEHIERAVAAKYARHRVRP